jgi:Ca2+-binding RTX toxin-like protein
MLMRAWLQSLTSIVRPRRRRSSTSSHLTGKRTAARQSELTGTPAEVLETRILPAVTFTFDYSLDASGFFAGAANAERRDALEQAGASLAGELNDTLLEIIPQKFSVADTWTAGIVDPATNATQTFDNLVVGEGEIRVYVGSRTLDPGQLAEGVSGFVSNVTGVQQWIDTVLGRGQAGALGPDALQTDFGPFGGSISFDPSVNWHFGTTTVGLDSSEFDFYSTALHELAHVIGFGGSNSWNNQVSGGLFTGQLATVNYDGIGQPPLEGNDHWQKDLTDEGQEVLLDPDLPNGTRKDLTGLDLAALYDIGWDVNSYSGGLSPTILLADGSPHTLLIEDDGIAGNGMSMFTLDGGAPTTFSTGPGFDLIIDGGDMSDSVEIASLDSSFDGELFLFAGDGDDTLTVNHSAADTVTYSGEAGSDTLALNGPTADSVMHSFASANDGGVLIADGSDSTISYAGLEPIFDSIVATTRTFVFGAAADVVTIADDDTADDGVSRISSVSSSETVDFAHPTGNVVVQTGDGDDILTVGTLDSLFGGVVVVSAGAGNDLLTAAGTTTRVSFDGDAGQDTLVGGAGNDFLLGASGDDLVSGGGGNDNILGGAGRDTLAGDDGDDLVRGNGGAGDQLSGGLGNDTLDGGSGGDFLVESGDVNFVAVSTALTGLGNDTFASLENLILTGGASGNSFDLRAFNGPATVSGGGGADTIFGSANRDVLRGDGGTDLIMSGGGNDFVDGGSGNDTLDGESGNDKLIGAGNDDVLFGSDGDDTLFGGAGRDTLDGGSGNDLIRGQGSLDALTGGDGDDTLDGDAGNDRVIESRDVDFTITNNSLTGVGNDVLREIESVRLTLGDSANLVDARYFSGGTVIFFHGGDDTLIGGAGPDYAVGFGGNDSLTGNRGNDTLYGSGGRDLLDGGDGNDQLFGVGSSGDRLFGGNGNDLLDGGAGGDRLLGGPGNDTLLGGDGRDRLGGEGDDDILRGGNDNDTLNGQSGNDTLIGDAGSDVLDGGVGNDGLDGVTGDDLLLGFNGNDSLYGGVGNDSLFGGADSDFAIGMQDDDSVMGDSGFDILAGGSGAGADPGDIVVGSPDEIEEFFTLTPPDWLVSEF